MTYMIRYIQGISSREISIGIFFGALFLAILLFLHIRKNASGVIRKKIKLLFDTRLTEAEIAELATLIYYPEEKLDELRDRSALTDAYYLTTVSRLIEVCRLVGGKYTRSKMRKHLEKNGGGFEYIIEELLNCGTESASVSEYHEKILNTVIKIGAAESIIVALADAIKSLVIDHLHIVGDIFDESDDRTSEFTRRGEYLEVDGMMNIYDLLETLEYSDKDFESEYTTVGGWATEMLDKLPEEGDTFNFDDLSVTVTKISNLRVEKLVVKDLRTEDDEDEEEE